MCIWIFILSSKLFAWTGGRTMLDVISSRFGRAKSELVRGGPFCRSLALLTSWACWGGFLTGFSKFPSPPRLSFGLSSIFSLSGSSLALVDEDSTLCLPFFLDLRNVLSGSGLNSATFSGRLLVINCKRKDKNSEASKFRKRKTAMIWKEKWLD